MDEMMKGSALFSISAKEDESAGSSEITQEMMMAMMKYISIRGSVSFGTGEEHWKTFKKTLIS